MFTNKIVGNCTYATRYIMSWVRMGGQLGYYGEGVDDFKKWLATCGLSYEEIMYVTNLATNGKLELEFSAKRFLKNIKHDEDES